MYVSAVQKKKKGKSAERTLTSKHQLASFGTLEPLLSETAMCLWSWGLRNQTQKTTLDRETQTDKELIAALTDIQYRQQNSCVYTVCYKALFNFFFLTGKTFTVYVGLDCVLFLWTHCKLIYVQQHPKGNTPNTQ